MMFPALHRLTGSAQTIDQASASFQLGAPEGGGRNRRERLVGTFMIYALYSMLYTPGNPSTFRTTGTPRGRK